MKDNVQRVGRWGNSLAVRIPKACAEDTGLVEGTAIEVRVDGGKLTVVPRVSRESLGDLLARVTPKNRHAEAWTDRPQGREIW